MTKRPTCTWDGQKWTQPDGTTCNHDHCAMRGHCPNHVQRDAGIHTCGACIRRTRKHLAAIVTRYALIAYDAQADGVDSEAMNLLGAAAAPEQYSARRDQLAALYERQGWCEWPRTEAFRPDDPHHPYAVLGRWDIALREQGYLGHTDLLVTVTRAAADLDRALDGPFPHSDEFETFAADIAACLAHLEAVDHDARTPERGRPCPACAAEHGTGPRLVKRYAKHPGYEPGQRCDKADCKICDGSNDAWHCPDNPSHAWTDDEYRSKVAADYVQHATELTIADLSARLDIPQSTIRRWASTTRRLVDGEWIEVPPKLTPARRQQDGRKLYRVADVRRVRDRETEQRTAEESA